VAASPSPPVEDVLPVAEKPRITLSFIAIAVFLVVIHSYRFNLGQAAMAVALVAILFEQGSFRMPPAFLWAVGFLVWATVSTAVSEQPAQTFEPVFDYAKVLLIGIVTASALRHRSQVSGFLIFWLACFAFWPVRGTFFNFLFGISTGGRYAWNFIFRNPNDLAGIVLLMLGLTLAATKSGTSKHVRWAAIAGTGMLTLIIFLTQSRGAFLGIAIFGLFAVATHHKRARALLATAALAAVVLIFAPASVWDRIGGLRSATSTQTLREADEEGSAAARYTIWTVSFAITADRPVTGVGLGSYQPVHKDYAETTSRWYLARGLKDTHSAYFNAMAETGLPGLVLLLGFVIGFGAFLARCSRQLSKMSPRRAEQFKFLLAAWIAYWIAAIFGTVHRLVFPYLFAGFATALAAQYGVLGATIAHGRRTLAAASSRVASAIPGSSGR